MIARHSSASSELLATLISCVTGPRVGVKVAVRVFVEVGDGPTVKVGVMVGVFVAVAVLPGVGVDWLLPK